MPFSRLNDEQRAAACTKSGANLVIASAGTGKTSTIVARIAHLLKNGILPERVLLLTFTNKAASEMISRLLLYFDKHITKKILAGTFHSVSLQLLKKSGKEVVLKQPQELKILLKSLMIDQNLNGLKSYSASYLYDIFSLWQNSSNLDFSTWFSKKYEAHKELAGFYENIFVKFIEEKKKFNYYDFNDLLLVLKKELGQNPDKFPVFDEILVDEYQDTNTLQGSLIQAFNFKSLFCVGDFDQSIYAFNGANIKIIGGFQDNFKDAKIYSLNINYRSSEHILNIANKVIINNPRLYDKKLIVSRQGDFLKPKLRVYDDLMSQYRYIAQEIENRKLTDIAIIFRNNSSADGLELALRERSIAYRRKGSGSFFDSKEIKVAMDIFSILINPNDLMAFIHIFQYAKNVGAVLAREIYEDLVYYGNGNVAQGLLNPNLSLEHRVKPVSPGFDISDISPMLLSLPIVKLPRLSQGGAIFCDAFLNLLLKFKSKKSFDIMEIIKNSKLYSLIANELSQKRATLKSGEIDDKLKQKSLEKIYDKFDLLLEIAKKYQDPKSLCNFITLGASEISEGKGVNLLSVHSSKGLEFEVVFLVDLAQERFPNFKLMAQGGDIQEERRLFYVAVTRAKDELYLSYARYDSKGNTYEPSCFLKEAGLI